MSAEKIDFAREWFERGECPGCQTPLVDVFDLPNRHYRGGDFVNFAQGGRRLSVRGEPASDAAGMHPTDKRLCIWRADDLTSLVLIGGGFLHSLRASC